MRLTRLDSGRKGEDLAQAFLKKQGYRIIGRNYKTRLGELDIIGEDRGTVVFIEVRSASSKAFGSPEYSIDRKKKNQIAKIAVSYIKERGLENRDCRFDVVCVEGVNSPEPKLNLIKNAFALEVQYRY